VELLVVITIIAMLAAMLLPAAQSAREAGRRIQCANHFKQTGLAMRNYHTIHESFPPGMIVWDGRWSPSCGETGSASQYHGWGWGAFILPHLEQTRLDATIDFDEWYSDLGGNFQAAANRVETYLCPSDPQNGELVGCCSGRQNGTDPYEDLRMTNMAGVADSEDWTCNGIAAYQYRYNDGMMGAREGAKLGQVRDGGSNTLLIGEVTGGGPSTFRAHFWATWDLLDTKDGINGPFTVVGGAWAPDEYHQGTYTGFRDTGFSSYHPGGCYFVMVDGSVQYLSENIASVTLKALTTRDGGEVIPADAF